MTIGRSLFSPLASLEEIHIGDADEAGNLRLWYETEGDAQQGANSYQFNFYIQCIPVRII